MGYPWKNMSPKDGFIVRQNAQLSDADQKILTFLYQPLIGAAAYSLFMTLWTEVGEDTHWSEGILHSELLTLLSIGIPEFYQARTKLEAIGLVKTYLKSEPEKMYIYELHAPQTSEVFFKDDLLSLLLFETVGERKYRNLRNRFTVKGIDKNGFEEITKSFLDVYRFDSELFKHEKALLKEPASLLGKSESEMPSVDDHTFDLKFFYDGLNTHYVKRSAVTKELEKTILVLHTLYGVNELAMQQYILEASDLETGKIDEKKLKKIVYDSYHQQYQQSVILEDVVEKEIESSKMKQQSRKNDLEKSGFTEEDIAVIEVSEQISPVDFLRSIKEQKGGFVVKTEEWTLEEIVKKANLPSAVINILIHYILVVRANPTFDKGLAYKIANDWAQSKVFSPEAAIEKVKRMYQENQQKQKQRQEQGQKRPAANYGRPVSSRKETLPDWAKDVKHQDDEKPISDSDKETLMNRLKQIQNFGKEGE